MPTRMVEASFAASPTSSHSTDRAAIPPTARHIERHPRHPDGKTQLKKMVAARLSRSFCRSWSRMHDSWHLRRQSGPRRQRETTRIAHLSSQDSSAQIVTTLLPRVSVRLHVKSLVGEHLATSWMPGICANYRLFVTTRTKTNGCDGRRTPNLQLMDELWHAGADVRGPLASCSTGILPFPRTGPASLARSCR